MRSILMPCLLIQLVFSTSLSSYRPIVKISCLIKFTFKILPTLTEISDYVLTSLSFAMIIVVDC